MYCCSNAPDPLHGSQQPQLHPSLEYAILLTTILACSMARASLDGSSIRPSPPRDMTVSSQALTEVRHLLVTAENPESSTEEHLDFERCSALHNAIVKHGWVAGGHDFADLQETYEWPPADECFRREALDRLHPDVIDFLKRCIDPGPGAGSFFRFLAGMPKDQVWWEWTQEYDEDWIQMYMASLETSETGIAVVWVLTADIS